MNASRFDVFNYCYLNHINPDGLDHFSFRVRTKYVTFLARMADKCSISILSSFARFPRYAIKFPVLLPALDGKMSSQCPLNGKP